MQKTQGDAYNELVSCLGDDEKTTLLGNFEKAHEQYLECKDEKFPHK